MSQWCTTCYRRPYRSCDSSCPVFGKDHDELAEMVLKSKSGEMQFTLEELANRRDMCDECDSETCFFNPDGYCLYPLVAGKQPEYSDHDGCLGWVYNNEETW